jgi:hypothetical protein
MDFGGKCLSFDLRDEGNVSVYLCNEGTRARLHIILSGRVWCHSCVTVICSLRGGLGNARQMLPLPTSLQFPRK